MRESISLTNLAQKVESQQESKQDYVVDTRKIEMTADLTVDPETTLVSPAQSNKLVIDNSIECTLSNHTHSQIAAWAKIPKKYYDVMPSDLRATNVNHWLQAPQRTVKRLVRTMRDITPAAQGMVTMSPEAYARAWLSDRYRMVDHFDIMQAVLPKLMERNDLIIRSCEMTDRRLYIKAGFKNMEADLKVGDTVRSGILISNSEIGAGAIEVVPYLERLWCTNGCAHTHFGQRRNHVGRTLQADEDTYEFYSSDTLKLEDAALMAKIGDTVEACVDSVMFKNIVSDFAATLDIKMEADPITVVANVAKKFNFTDFEQTKVLDNLMSAPDLEGPSRLTGFGLVNAITRTAEDVDSYDRATEFERLGGDLIALPQSDFQRLLVA